MTSKHPWWMACTVGGVLLYAVGSLRIPAGFALTAFAHPTNNSRQNKNRLQGTLSVDNLIRFDCPACGKSLKAKPEQVE